MKNIRYKTPVGWRRESWRHSLAAKGVQTKYYAPKMKGPAGPGQWQTYDEKEAKAQAAKARVAGANKGARGKKPNVENINIIVKEPSRREAYRVRNPDGSYSYAGPLNSDETALAKQQAKRKLEEFGRERLRESKPENIALQEIAAGRYDTVVLRHVDRNGKVTEITAQEMLAAPVAEIPALDEEGKPIFRGKGSSRTQVTDLVDLTADMSSLEPSERERLQTKAENIRSMLANAVKKRALETARSGAEILPIERAILGQIDTATLSDIEGLRRGQRETEFMNMINAGTFSQVDANLLKDKDYRKSVGLSEDQAARLEKQYARKNYERAIEAAKIGETVSPEELKALSEAERSTVEAAQKGFSFERALKEASAGAVTEEDILTRPDVSEGQRGVVLDVARQQKANRLIQQAQAGLPVAQADLSGLGKDFAARIKEIQKQVEEQAHPERAVVRDMARQGSRAVLSGVAGGVSKLGSWIKDTYKAEPEGTFGDYEVKKGFMERLDEFGKSPFFSNNALLDEPGQPGYNAEEGSLNYWNKEVPQADNIYDNIKTENLPKKLKKTEREPLESSPFGFAFGAATGGMDEVQNKVDSLHGSKHVLAEVDLSPFKRGTEQFKKGNREGLISSIIDLEREEARLKDNWQAVENIRQQVKDPTNTEIAFMQEDSLFSMGGAKRIADQNRKISDVKEKLMKSFSEVNSRKKMLQQRRQQLDANAKPEMGAPQNVKVFAGDDRNFMDAFKRPLEVAKSVYEAGDANASARVQPEKMKLHWRVDKSDFNSIRKSLARLSPAVKAPQEQRPWVR